MKEKLQSQKRKSSREFIEIEVTMHEKKRHFILKEKLQCLLNFRDSQQ